MKRSDLPITEVELSDEMKSALSCMLTVVLEAEAGDPRCKAILADWCGVLVLHLREHDGMPDLFGPPVQDDRSN